MGVFFHDKLPSAQQMGFVGFVTSDAGARRQESHNAQYMCSSLRRV